jgi:hypothetical protein
VGIFGCPSWSKSSPFSKLGSQVPYIVTSTLPSPALGLASNPSARVASSTSPSTPSTPATPSTPSACRSWILHYASWILIPAATDALHPAQPQRHAVQHPPVLPTTIGRPRSRALTTACTTLTWTLTWTWTCSHHAVALWPQACQGR